MNETNLSSTTYGYLAAGTYNAETMNQFATNSSNQSTPLFDFMEENPSGYQETTANECPSAEQGKPFWGWGPTSTTCANEPIQNWVDTDGDGDTDPSSKECKVSTYYIFGIPIKTERDCVINYGSCPH
jgi:hypothetical protein